MTYQGDTDRASDSKPCSIPILRQAAFLISEAVMCASQTILSYLELPVSRTPAWGVPAWWCCLRLAGAREELMQSFFPLSLTPQKGNAPGLPFLMFRRAWTNELLFSPAFTEMKNQKQKIPGLSFGVAINQKFLRTVMPGVLCLPQAL